ncbi:hypothetical protein AU184_13060 [Mycolicibacterium novocastrense]|uniref:DUF333 domain-containing protein n=1 Tax=Mycolicibacterium novocastrense TaxID=59813 RepID=A0AAW5SCR5_MYCNV|nr:hypothetical protein [Mycolicibacterium novocastrense]KUH76729.1 hypothetical protein AU183_05910 [Mycolicibacterium novocastrense]KUH77943.1 hypothetical protein AU072_08140 [Mycolicibacterium novocastrense]KUH79276.1 hypothetical protein AU184_13060 [Mycolicibacterium novocastrense]MCV7021895.1 hypothetical protein [Mycolicibacterium novocastrense]GAT07343.1 uncharacterized protein RMCN_0476 [Mycolicibacterium novocastrense]
MRRNSITAAIAAGAVAVGALITTTAPAAHAEKLSDQTIKSECKAAGGTYNKKGTVSTCGYKDASGKLNIDYYSGGHYVTTLT